jgi:hypothetical protein
MKKDNIIKVESLERRKENLINRIYEKTLVL